MVSIPRALPNLKCPAGTRRINGVMIAGGHAIGKRAEKIRLRLQALRDDR